MIWCSLYELIIYIFQYELFITILNIAINDHVDYYIYVESDIYH